MGAGLTDPLLRWPRLRVEAECARRGSSAVVSDCVALVRGQPVDDDFVVALGGAGAIGVLASGQREASGPSQDQDYWLRVWGLRGLLYAWVPDHDAPALETVTEALVQAMADPAWRVREMAAKVVARRRLDDALEAVEGLTRDPVPRVRAAAGRALVRLTG